MRRSQRAGVIRFEWVTKRYPDGAFAVDKLSFDAGAGEPYRWAGVAEPAPARDGELLERRGAGTGHGGLRQAVAVR